MSTTVQISTVIGLNKGLHLNAKLFAVMENRIVMTWQTPRPTIKIVALFKITSNFFAAKLSIPIATIESPTTTTATILKLEDFDVIARFTQLIRRGQSAKTST